MIASEEGGFHWPNIAAVNGHLVGLGPALRVNCGIGVRGSEAAGAIPASVEAHPLEYCCLASDKDTRWLAELRQSHPGRIPALINGGVVFFSIDAVLHRSESQR